MAEFPLNPLTDLDEFYNPDGVMTRDATSITIVDGDGDITWFGIKDITAFRSGKDFNLSYTGVFDTTTSQHEAVLTVGVQDLHVAAQDWLADVLTSGAKTYKVTWRYRPASNSPQIFCDEYGGGALLNRDSVVLAAGAFDYYFEQFKVGTGFAVDAWTDSTKASHISGFPLSIIVDNDIEMSYLMVVSGTNSGGANENLDGSISDMTFDFGGGGIVPVPPHIFQNVVGL